MYNNNDSSNLTIANAINIDVINDNNELNDSKVSRSNGNEIIICPIRTINGGLDIKFDNDPFNITLHGIMSPDDYTNAMNIINNELLQCRSTNVDVALLMMGPILVPLIPYAIRQIQFKKLRRRIMKRCVLEFNQQNSDLYMRYDTKPKMLTIMTRKQADKLRRR